MNSKLFIMIGLICPIALIANQSQNNILTNQFKKLALFYYDYYENFETHLINELGNGNLIPKDFTSYKILRNPMQSFSLVMNFNFNGNTELTFKGEDDKTYWQDQGICPHGYVYVPQVNACRELFCVEGFGLTDEDCIETETFNQHQTPMD